MHYDLLILNGLILDGTGAAAKKAAVGVMGDEITFIGEAAAQTAEEVIDASGLVVSPGFIDIHSHSDFTVLANPTADAKVRQGVTTEVVGNCGDSAAPMNDEVREYRRSHSGDVGSETSLAWSTMKEYMDTVDKRGVSLNIAPLVGHGTLRQNVMGFNNRTPTTVELKEMKRLLAEALDDGAWGLSTGLIYAPGSFAATKELVELARVASKRGCIYTSHVRGEADTVLEALREAITIGEKAKVPVEYSHAKFSRHANWGKSAEALKMIEDARSRGVDVTLDQYPYPAWSTSLSAFLPDWAKEGGLDETLTRLRDKKVRSRLVSEGLDYPPWDALMIVSSPQHPSYEGKNVAEIARIERKEPFDAAVDLMISEKSSVSVVGFCLNEDDVRNVMRHPLTMIGSDGSCINASVAAEEGIPHPRSYGTFPRVLGYYVREKVLTLPEAVSKMTSAPATRFGLGDRGILKEKYKADITVFDPEKVRDAATFTAPHRYPEGIPFVIVNGRIVFRGGEHTGAFPGKALRKK